MVTTAASSELDILSEVVAPTEPSFQVELARSILAMHFSDAAQSKIRELLDKNNRGTITDAERSLLEQYLRVGGFLDLLQAKARLTLSEAARA